ncbi:triose-phosphate isomerase [Stackebrandtia soli]|uniref:triose-phosphate isomerase n=1 Tax=Stackebrandtia soli TaxID=1892856 RepID=UPI0039ED7D21
MNAVTRRPLIAGNWKMNLNHFEAIALVQKLAFSLDEKQLSDVEVVVLPPYVDIRSVQTVIDADKLLLGYGAQDLSTHPNGAYTGEISGSMLAKLGCSYVVIGHSERRQYHHEDDELIAGKVRAALSVGISPILCVGEGLDIRNAGDQVAHVSAQLLAGLDRLNAEEVGKVVVAYEPVWAIGTGKTATPEDAQEVAGALRTLLSERYGEVAQSIRILYGGSVKSANVASIMAKADVDGALVGGASIDAEEFVSICRFPEHTVAS